MSEICKKEVLCILRSVVLNPRNIVLIFRETAAGVPQKNRSYALNHLSFIIIDIKSFIEILNINIKKLEF